MRLQAIFKDLLVQSLQIIELLLVITNVWK